MGAGEKKAAEKCQCKCACFPPHTQTPRINKQPWPGALFSRQLEASKYSASLWLEPRKTSSLPNTFTSLRKELRFPSAWNKGKEKNAKKTHRCCKLLGLAVAGLSLPVLGCQRRPPSSRGRAKISFCSRERAEIKRACRRTQGMCIV